MLNGVFSLPLPGDLQPLAGALPPGICRGEPLGEFIAGPENQLAVTAVLAALSEAGARWSPLVLHGPSGTGKSHLAGGLACEWRRRDAQAKIVHLFAAEYARELSDAIDTQSATEWENAHREADLLLVEDLDHLSGKSSAQDHLARTLDILQQRNAIVVLTASQAPGASTGLNAALRSRLSAGLTIALVPPGAAARVEIIQRLAAGRGLTTTMEGATALAAGLPTGVRDLLGALISLEARCDQRLVDADRGTARSEMGLEQVNEFLAARRAERAPSLATIAAQTARYYSLRLAELRGPGRQRNVALARKVAIYLARELTDHSLDALGEYFGGRDHTTALHAARRVKELLETDQDVRRAVERLREQLAI